MFELHYGDSLDVMRGMADNSVDAIVTDPPYGLSFMGKRWDYDVPSEELWRECLRVLKPGGHLLAFAGTRTQHRMAVRIEDAGFEIRDMIAWVYGSGFPKSLDVSKALDKAAGAERERTGNFTAGHGGKADNKVMNRFVSDQYDSVTGKMFETAPATDAARQWSGWGTALKPALEPITVARKPLIGTVAENVLTYGTGGVNVDGCRVGTESTLTLRNGNSGSHGRYGKDGRVFTRENPPGRFPANLIHDGSDEVVGLFPECKPATSRTKRPDASFAPGTDTQTGTLQLERYAVYSDSGSAARFFYCAKASKRDRDEGCEGFEKRQANQIASKDGGGGGWSKDAEKNPNNPRANAHPTVKPTDLMRYLCRLVTPPGGVVLDPFMGSGSTGKAAVLEGFNFIGIEREAEYIDIARARIDHVTKEPNLWQS